MNIDRAFAKDLCAELGIAWNSQALVPTLQGVPLPEEDLDALFPTRQSEPVSPVQPGPIVLAPRGMGPGLEKKAGEA